jgi:ankyrin repeat protein
MGQVEVMKLLLEEGAVVDHSVDGVHIKHEHKMNICAREREGGRESKQMLVCTCACIISFNQMMLCFLPSPQTLHCKKYIYIYVYVKERWTSLHFAAQQKRFEAVKILLEHGADPNAREPVCT